MITEISICYDYFPIPMLETILRNDLAQGEYPFLTEDAILHICSILCKRKPIKDPEYESRKEKIWRALQSEYYERPQENEQS